MSPTVDEPSNQPAGYGVSNDEMRGRLLKASWFLVAYELLKGDVIGRPQQLFRTGFKDGKAVLGPQYEVEVRSLAEHPFDASLVWLQKKGALSSAEAEDVQRIREYRNDVAHNLFGLLMSRGEPLDLPLLELTATLIAKLGRFWARQPLPGFDPAPASMPDSEVYSSTMFIIGYFAQVAGLTPTVDK